MYIKEVEMKKSWEKSMENKEKRTKVVTIALMVIYLVILTWIILFKMQFSIKDIGRFRSLNLIPFSESVIINGRMDFSEVYMNVIIIVACIGTICTIMLLLLLIIIIN